MSGFLSRLGGAGDGPAFDGYDEFVPAHVPEPGPFLTPRDVLGGADHLAFHRLTRALFEERTVYDVTFGYNLARLNCDPRHPDAGFRYAVEADDRAVLRAEFTPTTPFCPQTRTLATGAFRAWNGLADRHEYDRVRVRVAPMHEDSDAVNAALADLDDRLRAGDLDLADSTARGEGSVGVDPSADGPSSPF